MAKELPKEYHRITQELEIQTQKQYLNVRCLQEVKHLHDCQTLGSDSMITTDPKKFEIVYWLKFPEWYTEELIDGDYVYSIKPDAPERVKKSFEEWEKQKDD